MLQMREDQLQKLRDTAVKQTVKAITNRIDELAIRQMTVIGRDTDIIVEVPGKGQATFNRVRAIISQTARLEFKVVDDSSDFVQKLSDLPKGVTRESEVVSAGEDHPQVASYFLVAKDETAKEQLMKYIKTLPIPDDHQLLLGKLDRRDQPKSDKQEWRTYYVYRTTKVTGEDVKDAFVTFDTQQGNKPVVALHFNARGAAAFEDMTGAHVKQRMAIVLDDRVESAPVIQTKIGGGRAQDHARVGRLRAPS